MAPPPPAHSTLESGAQGHAYFRALIENAADLVTILDADGTIRYETPSVEHVLGYRPDELVGRNAFDLIHPEDVAPMLAIFQEAMSVPRATRTGEFRFLHKDGSWRTLDGIAKNMLSDPSVAGVVVNSRDVTERRRAEEALRRSNEALETLIRASPVAIMAVDVTGSVILWNPAAERVFGWTRDEILGQALPTLPPGLLAEHEALRKSVLSGASLADVVTRRQTKAGVPLDVSLSAAPLRDGSGRVYASMAVVVDITARKEAEGRVATSERKFRAIFEGGKDGMLLLDGDRFVECNPAALEMFGCTCEQITERGPFAFSPAFQPDGQASAASGGRHIAAALAGEPQSFAWTHLRLDGAPFDAEVSLSMLEIEGETRLLGIVRDITSRRRAEAELRESNERLTQALAELRTAEAQISQQERLRALGTMASGVAHDFNNALACILGFAELLLETPAKLDDRQTTLHHLRLIQTSAKDAASVVDRLRGFYRHRERDDLFVPVDLGLLVAEAVSLTQPKWKAQAEAGGVTVNIVTDLEPVREVSGSAPELREVLTNLIFNAVDAMPAGGVITIRTRQEDAHVVLEVEDTGTGMSEAVRRRCLDPFFTTKGEGGTGLGLATAYGIVQRHEGTIGIRSEVGRGTTFTIRLPGLGAAAVVAPVAPSPVPRQAKALRVLLVDDQPVVRQVIAEYLRVGGHAIVSVGEGAEALSHLAAGSFDLLIVDRAMPLMSGDEVAFRAKAIHPRLPVLMLTGFGSMMEAAGEQPAGVDAVLTKPVTLASLRATIERITAPR